MFGRGSRLLAKPYDTLLKGRRLGAEDGQRFAKGAYCLGKIVYGKGWEELLTLLDFHQRHTHESQAAVNQPTIDAYGSGEAFEHVGARLHVKYCLAQAGQG